MILGALEAGGTKMVCAIGNEQGEISERISIPTVSPEETMPQMIAFFREHHIEALGVGCFGPINPVKGTATYGYITSTPKLAWQEYNIVGAFEEALGCPVGFDTDVNASMLGEATFGIAKGLDSCIYVTIGTGVGVGVYINGGLLHGMMHPEAGHILLQRHPSDSYAGKCPFHGNCLEGLAAGPGHRGTLGSQRNRVKRPAGGMGTGSLLYRPGLCQLHFGLFSQENHSGRRRYAPGAAFPFGSAAVSGVDGGLCGHAGTGEFESLYRALQPGG